MQKEVSSGARASAGNVKRSGRARKKAGTAAVMLCQSAFWRFLKNALYSTRATKKRFKEKRSEFLNFHPVFHHHFHSSQPFSGSIGFPRPFLVFPSPPTINAPPTTHKLVQYNPND
jgi:hypothetical protein